MTEHTRASEGAAADERGAAGNRGLAGEGAAAGNRGLAGERAPAGEWAPGGGAVWYEPHLQNGQADPGEVVWGWVPYEDDPAQGKDRPVLVIGEKDGKLLTLMLTSKDHDRDAEQEARAGRYWMDVGRGGWDREGRPSEVRLNRLIVLDPDTVRREGSVLPRPVFDEVVAEARRYLG